jgi:sigma-E factor negative regulatory protein RseB
MQRSGYLLFALLQLSVATAFADPIQRDETDWLSTMLFAAQQADYSGVFVYQTGGRVEMSRITHVSDENGEHERLEGMGGGRRELIRHNDQVWLYKEGRNIRVERRQMRRAFPALLPEQLSILYENYSVRQAEEDEVAGYHAHTVIFQPKDNLRYTRKMWAHHNSGLLLKAVVLDEREYIIEQYAFMQLNINDNIDRKWIIPDKPAEAFPQNTHLSPLQKVEQVEGSCGWQVDALPPGFKKMFEMRRPLRENRGSVIQMVYSDGLAGVSVFIENLIDVNSTHSGLSNRGAAHVYNRIVGEYLVTVVGEVPAKTVIQIADSVRYAGQ